MVDTYTKAVLTVIALSLAAIALRLGGGVVPPAFAADEVVVRIDRPIELRAVDLQGLDRTFKVEVETRYGAAGSNSSNPIYVRQVQ